MFFVSYFFEIAAFITGLYYFQKLQPGFYRLVVGVLLITIINEMAAYLKVYEQWNIPKNRFYNFFFLLETVFYTVIFYKEYGGKKLTFQRNLLIVLFLASFITGLFFLYRYGTDNFNPFFLNVVCFVLTGFGLLYYYTIYSSEKIEDFKNNPLFWFSTGLIFVNFIHLLFVNAVFVEDFRNNPNSKNIFQGLNTFGNIIYYSLLIYSFICSARYRKQAGT